MFHSVKVCYLTESPDLAARLWKEMLWYYGIDPINTGLLLSSVMSNITHRSDDPSSLPGQGEYNGIYTDSDTDSPDMAHQSHDPSTLLQYREYHGIYTDSGADSPDEGSDGRDSSDDELAMGTGFNAPFAGSSHSANPSPNLRIYRGIFSSSSEGEEKDRDSRSPAC
jgi:hypothetical protein